MTCSSISLGGFGFVVICSRGKRWPRCSVPGCERRAPRLCDFPITTRKSGTCDAKLCEAHAAAQDEERDYCPAHAKVGQGSLPL